MILGSSRRSLTAGRLTTQLVHLTNATPIRRFPPAGAKADSLRCRKKNVSRRIPNWFSRRSYTRTCLREQETLESAVKFLLRPRQRGRSLLDHWLRPMPAKMAPFIIGADRVALLRLSQSLYAADKEHQRFIHARFGLAEDVLEPYKKPLERWLFGLMCSGGRTLLSPKLSVPSLITKRRLATRRDWQSHGFLLRAFRWVFPATASDDEGYFQRRYLRCGTGEYALFLEQFCSDSGCPIPVRCSSVPIW